MEKYEIDSFKGGLDRRRTEIEGLKNQLWALNNAHITTGGEIEQRNAFVRTALPANTYGLEATSAGLITFGSIADPGGWPIGGVTAYQRLQHPVVIDGGVYDASKHAMTAINWSYANLGYAFVSATFADGHSFLYYNGELVRQSRDGIVYSGDTNAILTETLGNALEAAIAGSTFDGANTVYADVTIGTVTKTLSTTAGYAGITPSGTSSAGSAGTKPVATLEFSEVIATATRARNANVGTLTFATNHYYAVGDLILVSGLPAAYNTAVSTPVLSVTATSLTYACGAGSEGATADTAGRVAADSASYNFKITAPKQATIAFPVVAGDFITLVDSAFNATYGTTDLLDNLTLFVATINQLTGIYGYTATLTTNALSYTISIYAPLAWAPWWTNPPTNNVVGRLVFDQTYTGSSSVRITASSGTSSTTSASRYSVFTNGVAAVNSYTDSLYEAFLGTWAVGDTWSFSFSDSTTLTYTIGKGRITGLSFINGYVHKNRVYLANQGQFNFSAVDDVTLYEQQSESAGYVNFNSQYGQNDVVQSFANYQGKLVVFGKQSTQIWNTNADPALFSLSQTLANIGTKAPFSVGALGELEVLFLAGNGIRSLRTRETTLNAYVNDLGSPIDALLQTALSGLTDAQIAASCSVVEPGSNRYWLFLTDKIYVLSYFPTSKITAWSTYSPTYSAAGTQTAFVPQKFTIYNGDVYARTSDAIIHYDKTTYDGCVVSGETPWLSTDGRVHAKAVDLAIQGKWVLQGSLDPYSAEMETLATTGDAASPNILKDSTYDKLLYGWTAMGTHFKFKFTSDASNTTKVMLSQITLHYNNK